MARQKKLETKQDELHGKMFDTIDAYMPINYRVQPQAVHCCLRLKYFLREDVWDYLLIHSQWKEESVE